MNTSPLYTQSWTSLDCNMVENLDWYETYMDLNNKDSSYTVPVGRKQDSVLLELENGLDHELFTSEGSEHLPGIFDQLNWINPIEDASSMYDPPENAIIEADNAEKRVDGERAVNSPDQMADDTANIIVVTDSTVQQDQGMKTVIIPDIDNIQSAVSLSHVLSSEMKTDQINTSDTASSGQVTNTLTLNIQPACLGDVFPESSSINTPDVLEFISSNTFDISSYIQQDSAHMFVPDAAITDSSNMSNATENNLLSSAEVSATMTTKKSTSEYTNSEKAVLNTDVSVVPPAEQSLISLDASIEAVLATSVGNCKTAATDSMPSGILKNLRSGRVAAKHKITNSAGPSPKYLCAVRNPDSEVAATGKKSDAKYQSMREKNNEASRKSRLNRKNKLVIMEEEKVRLERENEKLNIKVLTLESLKEEVKKLLIEHMVKSGQCVETI